MSIQLDATQKAALDRLEPYIEDGFTSGVEQPTGTPAVPKLESYDQPMIVIEGRQAVDKTAQLKLIIKAPFKTLVAALQKAMWPTWTTPTFQNSWRQWPNPSHAQCQYRKNMWGTVRIRGLLSAPVTPRTVMFTLPVGYRPATILMFPVISDDGFAVVEIAPDGDVSCRVGPAGNAPTSDTTWYSLSNISFEAE